MFDFILYLKRNLYKYNHKKSLEMKYALIFLKTKVDPCFYIHDIYIPKKYI